MDLSTRICLHMYIYIVPLPRSLENLFHVSVRLNPASHLPVLPFFFPPLWSRLTVLSFTAVRHVKSHLLLLEAPVERE